MAALSSPAPRHRWMAVSGREGLPRTLGWALIPHSSIVGCTVTQDFSSAIHCIFRALTDMVMHTGIHTYMHTYTHKPHRVVLRQWLMEKYAWVIEHTPYYLNHNSRVTLWECWWTFILHFTNSAELHWSLSSMITWVNLSRAWIKWESHSQGNNWKVWMRTYYNFSLEIGLISIV